MDDASTRVVADRIPSPASAPASSSQDSSASSSASHPDRVFTPPLPSSSTHGRHNSHHNPNHTTVHDRDHDHDHDNKHGDVDMIADTPPSTAGNLDGPSQLMLLSRIAEASTAVLNGNAASRKRTADGTLKEGSTSPAKRPAPVPEPMRTGRHSRTVSSVSMASTASRMSPEHLQASAKLAATLKYAMQKVQRGWQDFNIEEVESMAIQQVASRRASTSSPTVTTLSTTRPSPVESSLSPPMPMLAPPAPIEKASNPRRSSNARSIPSLLNHDSASSTNGPQTPLQQTRHARNSSLDPVLFPTSSQSHNVREQDAIASLIFMSSPGNTASLKRHATFSPESMVQPLAPPPPISSSQPTPARIPLPDSAPHARTPLPSQKPTMGHRHTQSASLSVGKRPSIMDRSPASRSDVMDLDSPASGRIPLPSAKRRFGAMASYALGATLGQDASERRQPLTKPAGLGTGQTPRRKLSDRDIEDMLDGVSRKVRAAANDSDSDDDGDIIIPPRMRIPLPA